MCSHCLDSKVLSGWRPAPGFATQSAPTKDGGGIAREIGRVIDESAANVNASLMELALPVTTKITPKAETPGAFGAILTKVKCDECGLYKIKLINMDRRALDSLRPGDYVEVRKLSKQWGKA